MPREIELKLRVDDPGPIRSRLDAAGARVQARVFEINRILDTADGRLRHASSALRVRERFDDGRTHCLDAQLTFKGPREPGAVKNREELETGVDDAATLLALLRRLGFEETVSYEKRREAWRLGGCEVVLDELPRLGWFLEIEGPNETAVLAARDALGLAGTALVPESYVTLAVRHGEDRGGKRVLEF